ncbi:AbfB domain-containing protein [Streptomyces coeruleorubidus]|uniref:AbfB domain-containing protein n=1 Tax=Streptomyces coeruleorubidus TaxID=116188 RepID=UPI00237F3A77|nr:AbfB domain-containing protein [Streptomyces coeruleorubidus]WDV50401.1 AbfB domain-containing protein [Streptomyces coeruleorubidus]
MNSKHIASARMGRIMTRGLVTATALAAVTGAVAPGAVADSAPDVAAADVAARAAGIGTTDAQRVEAAAVVRLDPTAEVLLLSDYDFIHALWQKASDAGEKLDAVRTAAEQSMASTVAEDHVRFIVTGVHEAYRLDQQREREKAEAERAARLAKSQVLLTIGIPSTPELLALSDDNFIRAVARHEASGPEVRAAALQALVGEPADWREFIVNGAREAHKRDVAKELADLAEKDRLEAERRKEIAARKNAAALFRITPSEAMLGLSDDNFIRELLRLAAADLHGTELYAEGQRATRSSDPAVWKAYIHTGADAAYKRDDENRRKKLAEANRQLAFQIQAAAENGRVNPNLVAAAKKALAGSDDDVAVFLKADTQYRLKRQSLRVFGGGGEYARQSSADRGKVVLNDTLKSTSALADREDATWVVVPSLASQPGCYSFESVRKPGYYIRSGKAEQDGLRVEVAADDRSATFRKSATWCTRPDAGLPTSVSFTQAAGSSVNWLAPTATEVYARSSRAFVLPGGFPGDASKVRLAEWRVTAPMAP